jgi:hypothetical protein
MEVFVPQMDEERFDRSFGEYNARFTPDDGVEEMRQFHSR